MTPTKFSQFLVTLTIVFLVSSCVSPAQVAPTTTPTATTLPTAAPTPTATTLATAAPTPTQTAEAQLVAKIDEYVTALVEQDRFMGSILVARDGKVLISKGYGMANLELDVPNTPQTKFYLASVTKMFTAMAILKLQQQGKLNVQDPICTYIRDCPEAWQPITIHHLLTHTSGIHNYFETPNIEDFEKKSVSPIQIIDRFRDLPLDFVPGESCYYGSSGYALLGYIIEKVSGQPYAIFLKHNIFEPLQMADTGYDNNRMVIKNRATGYSSTTTNADYFDMSVLYAAGGLYSTVEDLFRWDQALYTDKLISKPLRDEMFTPFVPIPGTELSFGYGWYVGKQFNHQGVMHGGRNEGVRTAIVRFPDDQVTIIVLSNLETTDVGEITTEIARMIFGAK